MGDRITLCKFQPGFGGKFKYFVTLNVLCLNEKSKYASGPKTCTCPLPVMLKKRQCNNKTTEKMYRNANASAKSKELQPDTQPDTVAAHLLLPQPHIKPSALTNDYFINLISRQYAI